MKIHIVKRGETLAKIAKKYHISLEKLKEINSHIKDAEKVIAGTKVKVPTAEIRLKAKEATPVSKPVEAKPMIPKVEPAESYPMETQSIASRTPAPEIPDIPSHRYPPQWSESEYGESSSRLETPPAFPYTGAPGMMPPMTPGMTPGMAPQGMPPQGMPPMAPQGMFPQGMVPQGIPPQGMQPQGMQPQGMQPQGMPPQGVQPGGMPPMMSDMGYPGMVNPGMAPMSPMMPGMVSPEMMGPGMMPPSSGCYSCGNTPSAGYPYGMSPYGMPPYDMNPSIVSPYGGPADMYEPYDKKFFTQPHYPTPYHEQLFMGEGDLMSQPVNPFAAPPVPPMYPQQFSPYSPYMPPSGNWPHMRRNTDQEDDSASNK